MTGAIKYLAIAMLTLGLVAEIVSANEEYELIDSKLFNKDAPLLSKSENLRLLKALLPLAEQNNAGNPKINTIKRLISAASPNETGCQPMGFTNKFYIGLQFSNPNLEAYIATCRREQLNICRAVLVEKIASSFSEEEKSVIKKFSGVNFFDVTNSLKDIIKEKTGPKRPKLERDRVKLFENQYKPIAAICESVCDQIEPLTEIFGKFKSLPEINDDKLIEEWTQKADFCHQMKYPTLGDGDYLSNMVFNFWI